jgi:chromosome segregation ATPase
MNEDRVAQRELAQDKINQDIMYALGEIKGTMTGMRESIDKLAPIIQDHEERISASENELTTIRVKIGIIGALIGAAVSFVGNWFWSKLIGH